MERRSVPDPPPSRQSRDGDPIRYIIDRRIPWAVHDELFSHQSFGTGPLPEQGWKLHVSASLLSAARVLSAATDVLLAAGARFKVARSLSLLRALNAAEFGLSQIGKFITVYPSDDHHAVCLAAELEEATRGAPGPRVPSDRPLRPGSLVHYRYGAMRLRPESELAGQSGSYDLLDHAGRLTNDVCLDFYVPPAGVVDPFEAAGVYVRGSPRSPLLNERYLVLDALSQSPRGGVFRAIDLGAPVARMCVLKEFWHDVGPDDFGRDARDWAANEASILLHHSDDPFMPRFFGSFHIDNDHFVAMEYVEGERLDRVLAEKRSHESGRIPLAEVLAIGLATADALARLHARGLVFRDFKPDHVIATAGGPFRLVDFGISFDSNAARAPALGAGTPDYCPPEQFAGEPPEPTHDVFAWGAMLHDLVCGGASIADRQLEPSRERPFRRKPATEIDPSVPRCIARVIDRAVAWEPVNRFASMVEARAALAEAASELEARRCPARANHLAFREPPAEAPPLDAMDALELARAVGDALCAAAEDRDGGLCWASSVATLGKPERSPGLYSGAAGIALYLAELAQATSELRYADAARGAARWLAGPVWGRGSAQHGLYDGEGGVAYFFLRLAALLNEPAYVTAAELRMRRLHGAAISTEDLMHGAAGTLLVLLRLHVVTGEPAYLNDARLAGEQLLRTVLRAPRGGSYWDVASGDGSGNKAPYLGLLHGSAGIGLALAELAAATGDSRCLELATGAAALLLQQARPDREGGGRQLMESETQALVWPRILGETTCGLQAQCHGAGGIAQFLLRLHRVMPDVRYREASEGGARALLARLDDVDTLSCLCHGIGGSGHVLIDVYQAFGERHWLDMAHRCAARLRPFEQAGQRGVYSMSRDGATSPGLMLGYAGVGSFLLRLADADAAREPILR